MGREETTRAASTDTAATGVSELRYELGRQAKRTTLNSGSIQET